MVSIVELMQLCRLCLVKDQANVPIFQEQCDIRQIFLKITACLPIKVSKDDNLPKKICDGCLYKLELLYQFWNTTADAEKQLLTWLTQAGIEADTKMTQEAMEIAQQSEMSTYSVKEEELDPPESTDVLTTEVDSFILQPPQLPIEPAGTQLAGPSEFNESQDTSRVEDDGDAGGHEEEDDDNGSLNEDERGEEPEEEDDPEPPPPKRSRRQAAIKAAQLVSQKDDDDEEEEDKDEDDVDDPTITEPKMEEESENSEAEDDSENPPPTDLASLGTAGDEDQPGPSDVGKTKAPQKNKRLGNFTSSNRTRGSKTQKYSSCSKYDGARKVRVMKQSGKKQFKCNICDYKCTRAADLKKHILTHTGEKPFKCNICHYKYTRAIYLKSHILTHTGDKPFKCNTCDYKCIRAESLKRHI